MFIWGIVILVFGFAALLLPAAGVSLKFLSFMGSQREAVCIGIAVVGGVLAFMGRQNSE